MSIASKAIKAICGKEITQVLYSYIIMFYDGLYSIKWNTNPLTPHAQITPLSYYYIIRFLHGLYSINGKNSSPSYLPPPPPHTHSSPATFPPPFQNYIIVLLDSYPQYIITLLPI